MTRAKQAVSMKDARVLETEVLVPKPKRFVRELVEMPDGYRCDWYYTDTPASVMIVPVTTDGNLVLVRQYRHNLKDHVLEFPAGTVSGAPKIRAMQIISELEQTARGPYAGCVGYFSFNGNLDTCITIRTALIKDGKAYIQAGGGWVADSLSENEFQETINKSMAMRKAIAMAENF